ncbi:hypothetical protein [Zobellella denitrificans]
MINDSITATLGRAPFISFSTFLAQLRPTAEQMRKELDLLP